MPKGQKPAFRFITKPEGSDKFVELGAAWALAKDDTFSASITLNGEKTNFLIVKNEPKPATPAAKQPKVAHAKSTQRNQRATPALWQDR
jgi:hypothetical protein